jgi:hypothetical protein
MINRSPKGMQESDRISQQPLMLLTSIKSRYKKLMMFVIVNTKCRRVFIPQMVVALLEQRLPKK